VTVAGQHSYKWPSFEAHFKRGMQRARPTNSLQHARRKPHDTEMQMVCTKLRISRLRGRCMVVNGDGVLAIRGGVE
jgi:hypothetical protein